MKHDWENKELRKRHSEIKKQLFIENPQLKINHSAKMQGISVDKWTGFAEPIQNRIRKSNEYKKWREDVFRRDQFQCIQCKSKKDIHAHHLIPVSKILLSVDFSKNIEDIIKFLINETVFFDLNNGSTLCIRCHQKNHPDINVLRQAGSMVG